MRRKTASIGFQSLLIDAHRAFASPRSGRIALLLIAFLLWCIAVLEMAAQHQK